MKFVSKLFIGLLLAGLTSCGDKKNAQEQEQTETRATDSTSVETVMPDPDWDFTGLYGIYLHEGSTSGYSATLTLDPQGLNLAFVLVSSKGEDCRGEAAGDIAMVDHKENYDTGYWIADDCKLEFIFRHKDKKVDVKEIHLCTLHDPSCGFEGTYSRKD